jgi:phosphoenolpyruvate carboxykinase (ATP)
MTNGRVNPDQTLEKLGVSGLGTVHYNLMEPALIEAALRRGEGRLGQGRRVPGLDRQVHRPVAQGQVHRAHAVAVENEIWWDNNAPMAPDAFDGCMPTCWST